MPKYDFYKYHGLGNDYIVIDPNKVNIQLNEPTVRLICNRNFGIGSDGILFGPIKGRKNFELKIYNPDGSEAEKSGNGLRIFARYLFECAYVDTKEFKITTKGGIVGVEILDDTGNMIRINMGKVTFESTEIPLLGEQREVVNEEFIFGEDRVKATCLSIGNPHCVIPMQSISKEKAKQLGPYVENHKSFPNRINMQLLKVIDRRTIEIKIWERGAGYTLASGSSACAAAAAAYKLGQINSKVKVRMVGGELDIEISDGYEIHMSGEVKGVYEGVFNPDLRAAIEAMRETIEGLSSSFQNPN